MVVIIYFHFHVCNILFFSSTIPFAQNLHLHAGNVIYLYKLIKIASYLLYFSKIILYQSIICSIFIDYIFICIYQVL